MSDPEPPIAEFCLTLLVFILHSGKPNPRSSCDNDFVSPKTLPESTRIWSRFTSLFLLLNSLISQLKTGKKKLIQVRLAVKEEENKIWFSSLLPPFLLDLSSIFKADFLKKMIQSQNILTNLSNSLMFLQENNLSPILELSF